jgi:hypothetical protein
MSEELKDTGERTVSSTGALKESKSKGKGSFHLLPVVVMRKLAEHYRKGAEKYTVKDNEGNIVSSGDRNWEKGTALSVCVDSAMRHLCQFIEGMEDEDHAVAACWWLCALIHYKEMIDRGILPKELDDLPSYKPVDTTKPLYDDSVVCDKWRNK